jgi:hypothetical protein
MGPEVPLTDDPDDTITAPPEADDAPMTSPPEIITAPLP